LDREECTGERLEKGEECTCERLNAAGNAPVNGWESEESTRERLEAAGSAPVNGSNGEECTRERLEDDEECTGERLEAAGNAPVNGWGGEECTGERLEATRSAPVNGSNGEECTRERLEEGEECTGEQHINTYTINTFKDTITLEQQQQHRGAAVVRVLFDAFGITGHSRLCERYASSFPTVQAWMLYAATCSLDNPQGFVVAKLRAGEPPPARFVEYARLKPDQWRSAWRAGHYGGAYGDAELPVDGDTWWSDFADAFENGPFGRGRVTPDEVEGILTRMGYGDASARVSRGRISVTGVSPEAVEEIGEALEAEGIHHRVEVPPEARAGEAGEGASWPVWERVLDDLAGQMTQATFDAHLARSMARRQNGRVTVYVSNEHGVDWLDARLRPQVERTARRLSREDVEIQFAVWEEPAG
jgi:hypothetical protein